MSSLTTQQQEFNDIRSKQKQTRINTTMESSNRFGQGLRNKIRGGRLVTTFTILGTLSACVLAGSMLTGRVSAKQAVDTSDAQAAADSESGDAIEWFFGHCEAGRACGGEHQHGDAAEGERAAGRQQGPMGAIRVARIRAGAGRPGHAGFLQPLLWLGGPGGGGQEEQGPSRALGSGFIVDPRGYIITNNHVIDKADRIYVKLSTDSEDSTDPGRPATVVGVDKETDIAVIKIKTDTPLPTVKLGNSDGVAGRRLGAGDR